MTSSHQIAQIRALLILMLGTTFELMTLDTTGLNLTAATDESGTLWVFVGTDSGFEGATTLYYNTIDVQVGR